MKQLIVVNGEVRDECIGAGIDAWRHGASMLDAAEQVARAVEDDVDEHYVGFSGLPNILGDVELDASVMDGSTRASGAIAGLKGFSHPISVARQVMERLPHVLLVGEGAARFAGEIGADRRDNLSKQARDSWLKMVRAISKEWSWQIGDTDPVGDVHALVASSRKPLTDLVWRAYKYHEGGDTMNVIACNPEAGGGAQLITAVTTSGVAWKYPGRVGDSPIIGAGSYADSRYGAATCTGIGELAIRQGTALRAVLLLRSGMTVADAGRETLRDLLPLSRPQNALLRLLLLDARGNVGGFCTQPGETLKVQALDEEQPRVVECEHVL